MSWTLPSGQEALLLLLLLWVIEGHGATRRATSEVVRSLHSSVPTLDGLKSSMHDYVHTLLFLPY